ncbi:hypothetical protein [Streptomyces sp. NPDC126499]|uniref:hypothetical protein n=1 Tax=Streptomyces sp. NPDC126499 TaxID=3155314 RepID=UPI003333013A
MAALLAVCGLYAFLNTNLFGASKLCGGLVTSSAAEAGFERSGKITDREGALADSGKDAFAFHCEIVNSTVIPGQEEQWISLLGTTEDPDFAFNGAPWPHPARMSFFSGDVTGAVGEGRGWVLLPESCWSGRPRVLEASADKNTDRLGLARLMVETAQASAEANGCGFPKKVHAPDTLTPEAKSRQTDASRVCGIAGFTLADVYTEPGVRAHETAQRTPGDIWSCSLTLDKTFADAPKGSDYVTYSVVQDPHIIAGLKSSPRHSEESPLKGRKATGIHPTNVVVMCRGKETYFTMEQGLQHAEPGDSFRPPSSELFTRFMDKVGASFGCA